MTYFNHKYNFFLYSVKLDRINWDDENIIYKKKA